MMGLACSKTQWRRPQWTMAEFFTQLQNGVGFHKKAGACPYRERPVAFLGVRSHPSMMFAWGTGSYSLHWIPSFILQRIFMIIFLLHHPNEMVGVWSRASWLVQGHPGSGVTEPRLLTPCWHSSTTLCCFYADQSSCWQHLKAKLT